MARTTTTTTTTPKTTMKGDNGGNGKSISTTPKSGFRHVTSAERQQMIQFAAYMKAEKRGFKNGDPMQDWVNAEKEVDAWLKSQPTSGHN